MQNYTLLLNKKINFLKSILFMTMKFKTLMLATVSAQAQKAPENWFNKDASADNVNGVSTEKTYNDLLKSRKSQTVIVAVIDSGVDSEHEDLKDVMWTNPGEIPGNGIDDDQNGYIDDIHGWNFLGGKDGKNIHHEALELTRLYAKLNKIYATQDSNKVSNKKEYAQYRMYKKLVEEKRAEAEENLAQMDNTEKTVIEALDVVSKALNGKAVTAGNVKAIDAGDDKLLARGQRITLRILEQGEIKSIDDVKKEISAQLKEGREYYEGQVKYNYNPDFNDRATIVGDDPYNSYENNYGNNDVKGPDASHGTHVAGIIAASRGNNKGMDGVADNVRIMSVRCVPDGDERDKDVANAIIYAVDNGAQVINMSFGKGYSWDKEAVDKAVKYAAKHDVLLVHAAGNDSEDNDSSPNFPTAKFEKAGLFKPKKAKNWMEIGALSWKPGEELPARFSNYGKKNVDVFSPGVDIYSTTPDGNYASFSGTSMASPVTAGVAALVRSYFPELTALQVKEIIEGSAIINDTMVKKPGSDEKVKFSDLSKTGGMVSAYNAVQKASTTKGKKKGGIHFKSPLTAGAGAAKTDRP
jgi:cell wall-associated protease